jgi:hypothetical protein
MHIEFTQSRIFFISHPRDQTSARLSNILDYQTVPMLTKGITGIFLLLLLYSGCTTNQRHIPFDISFSFWLRGIKEPFWVL